MNLLLTRRVSFLAMFIMAIIFAGINTAHAQSLGGGSARIFLSSSPEHPQPGRAVRITADSSIIDLAGSAIEWSVDDKIITESAGQMETAVIAGPLGSETDVSVVARALDGTLAFGEIFIRPAEVDLLWESDSFVPPFYRGRALPSAGTFIRAHALARFAPIGAPQTPEQDIIYTWKRNGDVVSAVSGRGRSSAILPAPTLFGTDTIQVNVATLDGKYEGEASIIIPSIEPILALYEDHPLFGVMYNQALDESSSVPDTEMSFAAIPYFAEAESSDDPALNYSWRVNGNDIPADPLKGSSLTVNADKSSGIARIALTLTHAANLFIQSSGTWDISFGVSSQ